MKPEERRATKQRILSACVKLFIEQGYHKTTLLNIIKEAQCSMSSFQNFFGTKNGVLLDLVKIMFSNQFETARKNAPQEISPVCIYAAETAIQLTITELHENLRDIYVEAYSERDSAEYIYQKTAQELKKIFLPYNPGCTEADFYEFEIGSAGIMRGFMARRCDQYFTLETKLKKFLIMTLRAYNVPKEEIESTIEFVLSLEIRTISEGVMKQLFEMLAMTFDCEFNEPATYLNL